METGHPVPRKKHTYSSAHTLSRARPCHRIRHMGLSKSSELSPDPESSEGEE